MLNRLTLQAIRIEQVFALFVAFHPAFGAPHTLSGDAPQQPLALVAVSRRSGCPQDEVVRRRAAYRIDKRLESLLVHVHLLYEGQKR